MSGGLNENDDLYEKVLMTYSRERGAITNALFSGVIKSKDTSQGNPSKISTLKAIQAIPMDTFTIDKQL